MKEKRSTKNALISSVLVLALSVSMLVGTTFAWFTDSSSAAVNSIKSGGLDVVLEMKQGDEWVDAEDQTLKWCKEDGTTVDRPIWQPGDTYQLQEFRVRNKGTLPLNYQIVISGIAGDAELNSVISWTYTNGTEPANTYSGAAITGSLAALPEGATGNEETPPEGTASDPFTFYGNMNLNAPNEYMRKEITGIGVTVVATQYVDGGSNHVTEDTVVYNEEQLTNALASDAPKTITLGRDINLSNDLTVDGNVMIVGTEYTSITGKAVKLSGTSTVTFRNVNFVDSAVSCDDFKGTVIFEGCTFSGSVQRFVVIKHSGNAKIALKNCTFTAENGALRFIQVESATAQKLDLTITDCDFNGCEKFAKSGDYAYVMQLGSLVSGNGLKLGRCTFNDVTEEGLTPVTYPRTKIYVGSTLVGYDVVYKMLTESVQTYTVP